MIVWVKKLKTISAPTTVSKSERPKEGSSCSGRGSASPTDCAPQLPQPSAMSPANLKPQQGQMRNDCALKLGVTCLSSCVTILGSRSASLMRQGLLVTP